MRGLPGGPAYRVWSPVALRQEPMAPRTPDVVMLSDNIGLPKNQPAAAEWKIVNVELSRRSP